MTNNTTDREKALAWWGNLSFADKIKFSVYYFDKGATYVDESEIFDIWEGEVTAEVPAPSTSSIEEGLKCTPGEWKCGSVMNFSGTLVSFIESNNKPIAQLRGCTTGEEIEAQANAVLIAAAPDLYNALKKCREWYEQKGFDLCAPETPICFSEALSALTKATKH